LPQFGPSAGAHRPAGVTASAAPADELSKRLLQPAASASSTGRPGPPSGDIAATEAADARVLKALAERLMETVGWLRPQPRCAGDFSKLQARLSAALAFLAEDLPRAASAAGVGGAAGEGALLGALLAQAEMACEGEWVLPSGMWLPEQQLHAVAHSARGLKRLLGHRFLGSLGRKDVAAIREKLTKAQCFFADVLEVASRREVSSWDVFEDLLQMSTYMSCIDKALSESDTRSTGNSSSIMASASLAMQPALQPLLPISQRNAVAPASAPQLPERPRVRRREDVAGSMLRTAELW